METTWTVWLAARSVFDLVLIGMLGALLWKLRDPKPKRRRATRPNVRKLQEPGVA